MLTFKPHQALEIIKKHLPNSPIIIEAGAYDGRETLRLKKMWPQGTIHCFEPVPEIFERLKENTKSLSNVHLYPIALSDTTQPSRKASAGAAGHATMYISEKPTKPGRASQANSLLAPTQRLSLSPLIFPRTMQVPTITLDDWAEKYSIEHIDFLKLDVQGYELNIMKASPQVLAKVKVVLTEVEFITAYENQYLYTDVKNWLENQGFTMIGKDFENETDWFFGNVLFVRSFTPFRAGSAANP